MAKGLISNTLRVTIMRHLDCFTGMSILFAFPFMPQLIQRIQSQCADA